MIALSSCSSQKNPDSTEAYFAERGVTFGEERPYSGVWLTAWEDSHFSPCAANNAACLQRRVDDRECDLAFSDRASSQLDDLGLGNGILSRVYPPHIFYVDFEGREWRQRDRSSAMLCVVIVDWIRELRRLNIHSPAYDQWYANARPDSEWDGD